MIYQLIDDNLWDEHQKCSTFVDWIAITRSGMKIGKNNDLVCYLIVHLKFYDINQANIHSWIFMESNFAIGRSK